MEVHCTPPLANLARLAALDGTQEDNFAAVEQPHPLVLRMALHADSQGDGHADQLTCNLLQDVPIELQVPGNEDPTGTPSCLWQTYAESTFPGDIGGIVLHVQPHHDSACPSVLPMLLSLVDTRYILF